MVRQADKAVTTLTPEQVDAKRTESGVLLVDNIAHMGGGYSEWKEKGSLPRTLVVGNRGSRLPTACEPCFSQDYLHI